MDSSSHLCASVKKGRVPADSGTLMVQTLQWITNAQVLTCDAVGSGREHRGEIPTYSPSGSNWLGCCVGF
jgi:hypothetical protein